MTKIEPHLTFALAGQPNVGKSTVFNMLTGLNQHVGNWPGKTVEQKTGFFTHDGREIRLVDLPGTYSLTANSEEERIARDFILRQKVDVVIAIVNAAALERNLYLIAEILSMPVRLVIGLNMMDVAEQAGVTIETHVLQAALGVPVIPLVATHNQGIRELIDAALDLSQSPGDYKPNRPEIRAEHRPVLLDIHKLLIGKTNVYPEEWTAIKLLEGDAEISEMVKRSSPETWELINELLMQHEDAYMDVAGGRYEWIGRMVRAAVVKPKASTISITDRLDKIATHPFWGVVLLLSIYGTAFWLTYAVAMPVVNWLDRQVISTIIEYLRHSLTFVPVWLNSLLVDGLISGAGAVLTLLPVLVVFFAVFGLLEDIGYLARSAYVMDRFMHWMGLHGRSFLPLFIGFGCNVPGILGTRIIDDRRARLLTILLMPLVPCTGRMAVIVFLAPIFFGTKATLVTWGLVAGNVILLFLLGIVADRWIFKGMRSAFIMEMPLYHLPNAHSIGIYIWQNTWAFIKKAGSVIFLASALVWLFSYLPDGDIQHSILARVGQYLQPIGAWLGLGDWRLIVALLSSVVAKENTIATMSILFGGGKNVGLAELVASSLTPAAALAFLVLQMTFVPCVATVAVMKQETASWKWPVFNIGLLLIISFVVATMVFHLAQMAGWGV